MRKLIFFVLIVIAASVVYMHSGDLGESEINFAKIEVVN